MGPDALLKSIGKKHRHRMGYEAGVSMLAKTVTAVAFVRCADPMPTLGSVTAILMKPPDPATDATGAGKGSDGEEEEEAAAVGAAKLGGEEAHALILDHPETDAEVRELCKDVQVLGRSEFKQLIRWRMKMRKALEREEKARAAAAAEEVRAVRAVRAVTHACSWLHAGAAMRVLCVRQAKEGEAESGSDGDDAGEPAGSDGDGDEPALTAEERVVKEMEALREREVAEARRTRKKRRELKRKAKIRLAQSAATAGIGEEVDEGEEALFSLGQVRGAKGLAAAGAAPLCIGVPARGPA